MTTDGAIRKVLREVFDVDPAVIARATQLEDIPDWDSVSHVQLMLSVESTFGVTFTPQEIASVRTIADLVNLVDQRLAGRP